MDKQEFFLLIPAIIYGVAIVDLLKIFQHKKNYWEVVAWGLYMFIAIVFAWVELYNKLEYITDSIVNFFLIIIQSILYARIVNIITPEEADHDTTLYFKEHYKSFFLTATATILLNYIVSLVVFDDDREPWIRPSFIILTLACAFYDKIWFRTSILGLCYVMSAYMLLQFQGLV